MEIKLKNKFRLLKSILYFLNFMTNSYEKYMWSIIQVELKIFESQINVCLMIHHHFFSNKKTLNLSFPEFFKFQYCLSWLYDKRGKMLKTKK